jgi:hypothetical protein
MVVMKDKKYKISVKVSTLDQLKLKIIEQLNIPKGNLIDILYEDKDFGEELRATRLSDIPQKGKITVDVLNSPSPLLNIPHFTERKSIW